MPTRFEWHERIKSVEREYWSSRLAIDRLSRDVQLDPRVLGHTSRPRDLIMASGNLEGTYLVRMFSEFEAGVRSFWRTIKPNSQPPASQLFDHVGAKRDIPRVVIAEVHVIRIYRNHLVHGRREEVQQVTLQRARSSLQTYLARFPERWG